MIVSIIVAVAENGVIGADGDMPWRLSSDLKRFKALTMGHPIVMGRKTFQSIGKALPGRTSIVISRDADFSADGIVTATSLDEALAKAEATGADEAFIIGGGEIYRQALPRAGKLHVTHVAVAPEGDTTFPPIDPAEWVVVSKAIIPAGEKDSAPTRYVVYRRNIDPNG